MNKKYTYALIPTACLISYFCSSLITNMIFGDLLEESLGEILGIFLFVITLSIVIFLVAINLIKKYPGLEQIDGGKIKKILIYSTLICMLMGSYISYRQINAEKYALEAEEERLSKLTPEQKLEEERIKEKKIANEKKRFLEEKRYRTAIKAKESIKEIMRDPDSLRIKLMLINEKSSIICVQYQGKNGLGGYGNIEILIISENEVSRSPTAWGKNCYDGMYDMTDKVNF